MDITFYPIETGKELTWFNDDDISHRIIINLVTQNNSTELVADSEIIKPDNSFTYTFEEEGTYNFYSPNYPWIKGTVSPYYKHTFVDSMRELKWNGFSGLVLWVFGRDFQKKLNSCLFLVRGRRAGF